MGPAHRTRAGQSRAAADQRGHRAGVMRGHERRSSEQRSVRREQPGHRVDRGDLQGFLHTQLGQQTDHALRQHRLARARRAREQQVVAPGRGHFHGPPRVGLAEHVGQVRHHLSLIHI